MCVCVRERERETERERERERERGPVLRVQSVACYGAKAFVCEATNLCFGGNRVRNCGSCVATLPVWHRQGNHANTHTWLTRTHNCRNNICCAKYTAKCPHFLSCDLRFSGGNGPLVEIRTGCLIQRKEPGEESVEKNRGPEPAAAQVRHTLCWGPAAKMAWAVKDRKNSALNKH